MPPPRKIDLLDATLRAELEQRLISNGFAGYHALSDWLAEHGYEISKTAIHAYGQGLKRKLAAIRASTEAAKLIADSAPDEADRRSEAVMSLVQTDLFDLLVNIQEAEDAAPQERVKLMANVARAIADLSRASIAQKKHAEEVRVKAEAAAAAVETITRKGGLSADAAAAIRREILGIAA